MKEKVKFLWIYTGILFSFALILIIFAYLTQNNMYKETNEISKGYQSNIEMLTKENENLHSQINELKKNEEKLNREKTYLSEVDSILKNALENYDSNNKKEAKELVKDIDKTKTNDLQNYIIDKINE
ncbi:MAG: hypothetical protein E7404_01645 [Ruminococcaceae bacterium]|nr:hypothetical protein [Oscillospiraceae bacterium]